MNNVRRKAIQKVIDKLEELKYDIECLADDEQEYLDNIPENLQNSDRYAVAEEAVDNLNSAMDSVEEAIDSLTESTN